MTTISHPKTKTAAFWPNFWIALALAVFTFLLIGAVVLGGTQLFYSDRIISGVTVHNIPIGGLTPFEAVSTLEKQFTYPTEGKIFLQDGANGWVATPAELGLLFDAGATSTAAFQHGRTGGLIEQFRNQLDGLNQTQPIAPTIIIDARQLRTFLESLSHQINQPVIEAELGLNGAEVTVRSGQPGRMLDIDKSIGIITKQLETLQDGAVTLAISETQPFILDTTEQANLAKAFLSAPLVLNAPEGMQLPGAPYTLDQATLASMLSIERVKTDTGEDYQVSLSSSRLRDFLNTLAPQLRTEPANPRFIFNDDTHQLEVLQNAVIGRSLNIEETLASIQKELAGGNHTLSLTMNVENPKVLDTTPGSEIGITELVHAETSYFYGSSAERVQNIQASAKSFHGLLIAPGETFSMASQLTDISLDNGYAEALIIVGNQTIKGVGGGVCQVSTTLFRTAFFTGFPIVERHAHAYRVYYYEKVAGNHIDQDLAGLDATVFVPLVDFKFTNDTPYWLLMETYVVPSQSSITWKFYSTSDGRTVDWNTSGVTNVTDPPDPVYTENPELPKDTIKQVDWAAKGADVSVRRTVYKDGNVYLEDTINTHYRPWPDMYQYGPGTELPNSTPTPESE